MAKYQYSVILTSPAAKASIRWTNRILEIGFDSRKGTQKSGPIQTTKRRQDRSPDHRTKGQEPTQITSQHTRNYPRNPYPQLPRPISLRRSQGKNRAFAGSSTIGRQVNQRIQSGILGARDGRIWPRNREGEGGGSDWHGTTSPNNDVGRKRERLLLGRATADAARVWFCVRAFRRCWDEVSEGGSVGAKATGATSWGANWRGHPHRTPAPRR